MAIIWKKDLLCLDFIRNYIIFNYSNKYFSIRHFIQGYSNFILCGCINLLKQRKMINPTFTTTFLALSIGGMVNSSYLVYKHYQKKPLVCPLNHDCSKVTESKWSKIFFIRNEVLGLLFFIFLLMSMIILIFNPDLNILKTIVLISTGLSLLFSISLVLIQKYIIKDYCFYCLISALITLLIFFNSAYLFY